ncbi:MAG: hypothetical protein B5M53_08255 [Candidatus Cloacimonas sp. 4484_209]|nr:MAG: hypothetical protein B5M53_08255 [Candidatus Cloacimonas sp. 4484_209]
MVSIIYLLIIIIIIVILIKFKVDISLVLFSGSILVGFLFHSGVKNFFVTLVNSIKSPDTLSLVATVILVIYFGALLAKRGDLSRMVSALRVLINDNRVSMVVPSSIMGLLPMPGGALISAPMLEEGSKGFQLNPAEKTFLNFWFRHLWEYCWPLYPGLIVASTILKLPIFVLSRFQFPLTLVAILAGLLFGLKKIKFKAGIEKTKKLSSLIHLFHSTWHISLIIIFVIAFKINVLYVMIGVSLLVSVLTKFNKKEWKEVVKESFQYKTILLLFSVMFFKAILLNSGAIASLTKVFTPQGPSLWLLLFFAPFLVGFLTGVNHAYVGVAFPILLPFFLSGGVNLAYIMFSYASGFAGVLLSPVHLCLVLTKQYFKADFSPIYKLLIPPVIFVWLFAFLMFIIYK